MFGFNWWKRGTGQATKDELKNLTVREMQALVRSVRLDLERNGTMTYSAQDRMVGVLDKAVTELAYIRTWARLQDLATDALYMHVHDRYRLNTGELDRAVTLVVLVERYPLLKWAFWTFVNPFVKKHTNEIVTAADVEEQARDEKLGG